MNHSASQIGRNSPCPCGSGRKYKKCCLQEPRIMSGVDGSSAASSITNAELDGAHVNGDAKSLAEIGWHAVAVLDVLGQSDWLTKWNFVPDNQSLQEWLLPVKKSMGTVKGVRDAMMGFWRSRFSQVGADPPQLESTRSASDLTQRPDSHSVRFAYFSDTIIAYSCLGRLTGIQTIQVITDMLASCAATMLTTMGAKVALRGAIEIGVLTSFETGDPYGPALAVAHHLESKCARWPRVLIGKRLMAFVDNFLSSSHWPLASSTLSGLIARTNDGDSMVDWLGATVKMLSEGNQTFYEARNSAEEFARNELKRFADAGDSTLIERYEKLIHYIESRPW